MQTSLMLLQGPWLQSAQGLGSNCHGRRLAASAPFTCEGPQSVQLSTRPASCPMSHPTPHTHTHTVPTRVCTQTHTHMGAHTHMCTELHARGYLLCSFLGSVGPSLTLSLGITSILPGVPYCNLMKNSCFLFPHSSAYSSWEVSKSWAAWLRAGLSCEVTLKHLKGKFPVPLRHG